MQIDIDAQIQRNPQFRVAEQHDSLDNHYLLGCDSDCFQPSDVKREVIRRALDGSIAAQSSEVCDQQFRFQRVRMVEVDRSSLLCREVAQIAVVTVESGTLLVVHTSARLL